MNRLYVGPFLCKLVHVERHSKYCSGIHAASLTARRVRTLPPHTNVAAPRALDAGLNARLSLWPCKFVVCPAPQRSQLSLHHAAGVQEASRPSQADHFAPAGWPAPAVCRRFSSLRQGAVCCDRPAHRNPRTCRGSRRRCRQMPPAGQPPACRLTHTASRCRCLPTLRSGPPRASRQRVRLVSRRHRRQTGRRRGTASCRPSWQVGLRPPVHCE